MSAAGVAQIVHSLEIGGMERVAAHLAAHLSAAYRPLVICLTVKGHFAPLLEQAGIEVVAMDKQPGKDLALPRRLAGLLRRRHIRLVHAHNSGPMFSGTLAARLAGAAGVIVTDHSRKLPERFSVMATEFVVSRLADEIVSVSEQNRVDLIKRLHWPARKISVIPNGVAEVPAIGAEQRTALRSEFGLPPGWPVVLTVARLEKQKNIALMIEAARALWDRGVNAAFLVAGDGEEKPKLEKTIAESGLGDRFILAGWRLDSLALYHLADVFALSSDWEGLPMSVLEAMSAGLPVVATDVGDVSKAVERGKTGLLVPSRAPAELAEALAHLLTNPPVQREMGEAGCRRWRQEFSVERMVQRYEELYARYA